MKLPDQRLTAFLAFGGNAEEAMRFYEKSLPSSKIVSLVHFGKNEPHGDEGKVLSGTLSFAGQAIMFMDMQAAYPPPPFSWSSSLLINCRSESEFDSIFECLSKDGTVMMGPEPVMHMRKCTWVTDRFGVTWQLVWE